MFLEGKAELMSDGQTKTIHAHAVALVPAHTKHNVRNESKAPMRYVYSYVMALDGA